MAVPRPEVGLTTRERLPRGSVLESYLRSKADRFASRDVDEDTASY